MENKKDLEALMSDIDKLFADTDVSDVTQTNDGSRDLDEGYYLSELVDGSIEESKSSGLPQVKLTFKTVEDGKTFVADKDGNAETVTIKNSKNKMIYMYFSLKDDKMRKRFVSDMLKFEDGDGVSVLDKSYLTSGSLILQSIDVVKGMNLYIQITKSEKDGQTSTWKNIIPWKRAIDILGL